MYWLLLVSLQLVEKTTASYFFIPTQVTLSPLWINDNYPSQKQKSKGKIWWNQKKVVPLQSHLRTMLDDSEMNPTGRLGEWLKPPVC